MKTLPFPPLNRDLSRLVLGSMVFHPDTPDASFELLDLWRELGGNTIDSAHIYQGGSSERTIGAYLAAFQIPTDYRDRLLAMARAAQ